MSIYTDTHGLDPAAIITRSREPLAWGSTLLLGKGQRMNFYREDKLMCWVDDSMAAVIPPDTTHWILIDKSRLERPEPAPSAEGREAVSEVQAKNPAVALREYLVAAGLRPSPEHDAWLMRVERFCEEPVDG